ncbi:MAG: hypothetical protein LIO65_06605 [Odoribacter sp.]|nr:hypothetical protein [Odoribacter sp.]
MGLIVLVFSFSAISCTNEDLTITPDSEDDTLVHLTITTPGSSLPKATTRATIDTEYNISDIRILVFSESNGTYRFNYMMQGQQIRPDDTNPQKTHFSACLKTSEEPIRLLFVANSESVFTNYTPVFNQTEEEVRKKVVTEHVGNYETKIPMFGEKNLSSLNATEVNKINLTMLRAVGRVDVEVDLDMDKSRNFIIESVHIYRSNDKVQVIPDREVTNESATKVNAPSVPSDAMVTPAYSKQVDYLGESAIHKLYVSEATHIADANNQHFNATCVVVGGYYNGEQTPTYYRADFNSEQVGHPFGQVLRNHRYLFKIRQVNGSGWETPDEAAENRSTLIVTEIKTWEDFMMEMHTNGDNYLGIASRDVVFNYKAGLEKIVKVQATVPYKISWEGHTESTIEGGAAISNEYFSAQIKTNPEEPDDVSYIQFTTLKENKSNTNITSKLTVEWGNWIFTVNVTQLHYMENVLKSVHVLSFNHGATGALGSVAQSTANGLTMRRFLSNVNNFSASGTVNYFAGFSFSETPNLDWLKNANEGSQYAHWVTAAVYAADVIYLANDNYCTPWAARLIMKWLNDDPHRVLIIGGDGNRTSPGFLLPTYEGSKGLLVDEIDWWYNVAVVAGDNNIQNIRQTGDYFKYLPNDNNKEFFSADSPFGQVNTADNLRIVDGYFGYAKNIYNEDIIPLIGHSSGDQPILAINKKQRIIYFGDASIFEYNGTNMMGTTGVVTNSHEKFFSNLWAWIAHQVIWGDDQLINN